MTRTGPALPARRRAEMERGGERAAAVMRGTGARPFLPIQVQEGLPRREGGRNAAASPGGRGLGRGGPSSPHGPERRSCGAHAGRSRAPPHPCPSPADGRGVPHRLNPHTSAPPAGPRAPGGRCAGTPAFRGSPAGARCPSAPQSITSMMRPGRGDITTMRVDRNTASGIEWVTNRIVLPVCAQMRSSSPFRWSRTISSSAPKGSSMRSSFGSKESARAMEARCCMPPESCQGYLAEKPPRLTSSR